MPDHTNYVILGCLTGAVLKEMFEMVEMVSLG